MAQRTERELRGVEIFGVGPEAQAGAGIALADAADDVERGIGEAVAERHPVFVAVAADEYFHPSAQGIDHADADAVQATGKRVVLAAELAAGMQPETGRASCRDSVCHNV